MACQRKPSGAGATRFRDIQVALKTGDAVLLECKWDDSHTALETQLDERLEQSSDALAVVGVLYPERLKYAEGLAVQVHIRAVECLAVAVCRNARLPTTLYSLVERTMLDTICGGHP